MGRKKAQTAHKTKVRTVQTGKGGGARNVAGQTKVCPLLGGEETGEGGRFTILRVGQKRTQIFNRETRQLRETKGGKRLCERRLELP